MKGKLKFAISALVWALILMAAYVVSMHAQTNTTANQTAAKKGRAAETFGINPAVTGSGAAGLLAKFVGDGSVAFHSNVTEDNLRRCGVTAAAPSAV